ncbi:MAG: AEC family transporter [Myxococcota bacterium]
MPHAIEVALGLAVPVGLGALAGVLRLFEKPLSAVDHLSRFALYFAFPGLIVSGLAGASFALPREPGFWAIVPAAFFITVGASRLLFRTSSHTLALVNGFGNVAYLGLPLVEAVLGSAKSGLASLAVAIHVTLALTLGQFLLLHWAPSTSEPGASMGKRLARQPLLWSPLVALAAHLLPATVRSGMLAVSHPLGRSAGPVALFLLGLYLHTERGRLRRPHRADLIHGVTKLVALPAVTFALAIPCGAVGWLTAAQAQVLLLLSAMPAAITTFAIAHQLRIGTETVARTIVMTTLVSLVTIPLAVWLTERWLGESFAF